METLAAKYFSFLFLTIFGGGWTVPLGLPPGPEEPAAARVAPEKCLFYASWAGMAAADPKSKNQTEQLLAEPEVQRCFAAVATFATSTLVPDPMNAKDDNVAVTRQAALDLAKLVVTHPGAVFATEIKKGKNDAVENIRGGMLVAAGQDADALRAAFEEFRKQVAAAEPPPPAAGQNPPQPRFVVKQVQIAGRTWYRFADTSPSAIPPVICGFDGTNFIVGVGDGSVEEILKRRGQEPPAWLVNLRKQLPVERVSTVVHFNLKMLLEQMTANDAMPKTREALQRLGLDKLAALSSVSGLEGETFTSKMLLATDGEPQGPLLTFFSDQPLRAEDLKPIPRDATLGFAMRFDPQKTIDQFAALMEEGERSAPGRPPAVESPWDALTKSLEVDLRRDLPKALSDTCCIYSSPGEGGLALLGLTAVVPIKDRDVISVIQAKLLGSSLGRSFLDELSPGPAQRGRQRLQSFSFKGQRIFYFSGMGWEICPAWCATDRELVVAMAPQNVMAYLQHDSGHKPLSTVPQVKQLIESGDGPSMMLYVDTAKLFELAYPFVPLIASSVDEFAPETQPLPLHAIPSAPAIGRHMVPGTAALRRTKQGLELISRQPLPGTGLLWTSAALGMTGPLFPEEEPKSEVPPQNDMNGPSAPAYSSPPAAAPATNTYPGYMPVPGYAATPAPSTAPAPGTAAPVGALAGSPTGHAVVGGATGAGVGALTGVPTQPATTIDPSWGQTVLPPNSTVTGPSAPAYPAAYAPAPGYGQGAPPWLVEQRRLELIGAGVKAYRDKQHTMPPAYVADKEGKPLLSWRVALLPYVGQEDLYKRFHLDEPWDSPHNRELIPLIPQAYQDTDAAPGPLTAPAKDAPAKETAGKTRFLLLRGPKTVYAEPTPPMPRTYEEWLKVIVVVAASERAVPWTKPEECTYEEKHPRSGLAGEKSRVYVMLKACGDVVYPSVPDLEIKSFPTEEFDRTFLRFWFTGEDGAYVVPLPPYGSPATGYAPPAAYPATPAAPVPPR
jgi:hypothetical protein